jgi:hypothetical protein
MHISRLNLVLDTQVNFYILAGLVNMDIFSMEKLVRYEIINLSLNYFLSKF